MLRFSNLGFFALFSSVIILLFQSILSLSSKDFAWQNLSLVDVLDPKYYSWVNEVALLNLNGMTSYVLNLPMFVVFFCLTIIFFVMGGIFEK